MFSFAAHLVSGTRSERSPLASRGDRREPRGTDGEGFSEGHAKDFGALVPRAAVEIWSGRPKPARRCNIPRRSAAARGKDPKLCRDSGASKGDEPAASRSAPCASPEDRRDVGWNQAEGERESLKSDGWKRAMREQVAAKCEEDHGR